MQKSPRWYKEWKCPIKRTHLNVWLVKVNVVWKFFICHTPWDLSRLQCRLARCSPECRESISNGASAAAPLGMSKSAWPWHSIPILQTSYSKNISSICCILQLPWEGHGQGQTPKQVLSKHQTAFWGLPVQCSFHKTSLASRFTGQNAQGWPLAIRS